jgi:hypothetical protein
VKVPAAHKLVEETRPAGTDDLFVSWENSRTRRTRPTDGTHREKLGTTGKHRRPESMYWIPAFGLE